MFITTPVDHSITTPIIVLMLRCTLLLIRTSWTVLGRLVWSFEIHLDWIHLIRFA